MIEIPEHITQLQETWGRLVVLIGKALINKDKVALEQAIETALDLYDFPNPVLFKPTKACELQFRTNREAAKSYFIAGNTRYPEDHGFALTGWMSVRFENEAFRILDDGSSIVMGNYYFKDPNTHKEIKVEYTFGYTKEGKIFLHHSSLPYSPQS